MEKLVHLLISFSMDSYKYLYLLAIFFSEAKEGIYDVIFFYYSDCLCSYYEKREEAKLKKEILKYTLKASFFSILDFIYGFFDR